MFRKVIYYGVIAGLVVGSILFGITVANGGQTRWKRDVVATQVLFGQAFLGLRALDQNWG